MNGPVGQREGFAAFLLRARARGINDARLYQAIEAIPRAEFVPSEFADAAWSNRSVPIACGESIEGIDFQAMVLSSLGIEAGHRVLEIGTGTGYTAAVMGKLGAKVKTVDRFRTLASSASERFATLGLGNVLGRHADGSRGFNAEGPFDRIVVWAAFDATPRHFVDQLASNGIMIAPIGPGDGVQELVRMVKIGSRFDRSVLGKIRAQPLYSTAALCI